MAGRRGCRQNDLLAVEHAIDANTRAIFCETIANPGGYISDLDALARIADQGAEFAMIVDNTATPTCASRSNMARRWWCIRRRNTTGNGTVTGGVVIDSGKFDWSASDKFPSLSQPEPAYHGLAFHPALGSMAFTFHSIAVGLRDLGMTMNPQARIIR